VPTVDIHTHYIPSEVLADASRGQAPDGLAQQVVDGVPWLVHRQGFRYPVPPPFHDVEARLAAMDALGIDQAVVSIAPTLFLYWADPEEMADFCRAANDSLARFAAASGGRIVTLATLPLQAPDAAIKELHRAVAHLGLRGAEIGPAVEDVPLDDPSMLPLLDAAQDLGVPLVLHPYYVGPRPGLADFYLTNLLGNPIQSTVCAARMILSGTLDDLDRLELVLLHGGGFLPYQIGRIDHGNRVRPEARACRRPPSEYLRRFTYDTVTHAPRPLAFLVSQVGAERVAYGTDYPFDMAAGPFVRQIEGAGLDGLQREQIAWRTAARLFRLEPASGSRPGGER